MGFLTALSGWRAYRKLGAEWRNIVFYSESGQDWHWFSALIEELNTRLGRRVTYVTSDPADPGLGRRHARFRAVCIPEGLFLTLHFNLQKADVVVMTMMDLDNLQLKKSINPVHYVYLFHSLGSTHMVDHANSYDAYDTLFCAGPHHVAELRKRESLAGLPARNLFEYGHPRLEQLLALGRRQSGASGNSVTTVLVAPTWGENSIFNACGERLVGVLLDAGYRVIARPHYQTRRLSPGAIDALQTRFREHVNFELGLDMGESESLLRSDVLVSDWSAMAIEYALGLEKPVLYIDLPRRVRNPDWQALGIEPLEVAFRKQSGVILSPQGLEEAPQCISRLLEGADDFKKKMASLRSALVFNPGCSVALGAREIARLAEQHAC